MAFGGRGEPDSPHRGQLPTICTCYRTYSAFRYPAGRGTGGALWAAEELGHAPPGGEGGIGLRSTVMQHTA